jgi:hypothetical protein
VISCNITESECTETHAEVAIAFLLNITVCSGCNSEEIIHSNWEIKFYSCNEEEYYVWGSDPSNDSTATLAHNYTDSCTYLLKVWRTFHKIFTVLCICGGMRETKLEVTRNQMHYAPHKFLTFLWNFLVETNWQIYHSSQLDALSL